MGREEHEWLPENLKLITQNKREQQRGRRRGGMREGEEGEVGPIIVYLLPGTQMIEGLKYSLLNPVRFVFHFQTANYYSSAEH